MDFESASDCDLSPAGQANPEKSGCACCKKDNTPIFDHAATNNGITLDAEQKKELVFLSANFLLFIAAIVCDEFFADVIGEWGMRVFFAVPYLLCALPVFKIGVKLLGKGDWANEFILMGLATCAAIVLGHMPEAVGVMLFYRMGEFVQDLATARSRGSIKALLAGKPTTANVLEGDAVKTVPVEEVEPGRTIIVRAGEKIPLDGLVLSGLSQVDQSPLTGESVPVAAAPGFKALAGSINMGGVLTIKTTNRFADTHMARIMELVENAIAGKSPTERFITTFSRYYTPLVILASTLVATLPPLLGGADWSTWIYRALVLLVISCPCALLISIPLGYFGGIGLASRHGILVKGGNVMDGILSVKTVIFDKTGTLTHGVFDVGDVSPAPGITPERLWNAAGSAEIDSNHPVARAIIRHLPDFKRPSDLNSEEVPGKGMRVSTGGKRYLAGNIDFLRECGLNPAESELSGTVIYLAEDTTFLGHITVSDRIKEDASTAVAGLSATGLTSYMLTGDKENTAVWVAGELKLDGYKAGLLPEDKVAAMRDIARPEETAFVGDGINDTPSLALARVGIAMGGVGSEAAIETADAVILNDRPSSVVRLISIARQVRAVVWQNIVLALGVKTAFMALGVVGLSGLWEAVFADVGVALLAVLNSARGTRVSKI